MGVAGFDDDELVIDRELQLPVPKKYSILNPNDSDSSSDDKLIPITDESTDQLISPTEQVHVHHRQLFLQHLQHLLML